VAAGPVWVAAGWRQLPLVETVVSLSLPPIPKVVGVVFGFFLFFFLVFWFLFFLNTINAK
jgi:hypothetical protein